MHKNTFKMSSAKFQPLCPDLNMLTQDGMEFHTDI